MDGKIELLFNPGFGYIGDAISHVIDLANQQQGRVWLLFNDTTAEVNPGDTRDIVYGRWQEFRTYYQKGKGLRP
jgi:hypothetical protein